MKILVITVKDHPESMQNSEFLYLIKFKIKI